MALDYTTIITTILGLLFSGGLATLITLKYTKSNAKTEANSNANKEQSERIDLGDKYVTQMLAMLEKIQETSKKNMEIGENNVERNTANWESIDKKMTEIHTDLIGVKSEVTSIVQYLNGGYKEFKSEHPELGVVLENNAV